MSAEDFQTQADVIKVDDDLGLVFGWAIVCKQDGKDYFDVQGDHIPEASMLKASVDFMQNSRVAGEMHRQEGDAASKKAEDHGTVVFAWPMTTEVAKAFGMPFEKTGLMIAMRPDADVLAKFKDGTYTGFSIGGKYVTNEEVK